MEFEKTLQVANIKSLEKKLDKIFNKKEIDSTNFLDNLIADRITWHCGGMSDPFQPAEGRLGITKQMIDISNKHNISILFSTKSNTVYGADIRPDLHSFQLSITNLEDRKDIEPGVASMDSRIKFYKDLKARGFKVGIRVQPFIPGVTTSEIVDIFSDADYFTIEGLKLVPQNKKHVEYLIETLKLNREDFKQMGLLNIKPEIRVELYKDIVAKLEKYNISYSLADNDLHHISSSKCCCGEPLIKKSTDFNNTALIHKYGRDYTLEDVISECENIKECKANQLFTSNRQEGCTSVEDFFIKRFDRKSSPFSPKYLYDGCDGCK